MKNIFNISQAGSVVFQYEGPYSPQFNFQSVNTYSATNNYLLAQVCGLIYNDESDIQNQVNEWNSQDPSLRLTVDVEDIDDFRFMALSNDDFLIVAFRGSSNLANWLTDFDIILMPFENNENALVHQGFYLSVLLMQEKLQQVVNMRRNKDQPVYITGHSLGAAQAILTAFTCPELQDFVNVTTFGEPKVGDSGLTVLFNAALNSCPASKESKIFRNVNGWDPVPSVPIFYGTHLYYHEGYFYLYAKSDGDMYEIRQTHRPFDAAIIGGLPEGQSALPQWHIYYHSIGLYISNALANVNNPVFSTEHNQSRSLQSVVASMEKS